MDRRFMALRVAATILKVLAWLMLIMGLLIAVGVLIAGLLFRSQPGILGLEISGPMAGISAFVVVLILSILNFLLPRQLLKKLKRICMSGKWRRRMRYRSCMIPLP